MKNKYPRNIRCSNCQEIVNKPPCHTINKINNFCNRKCYIEAINKDSSKASNFRNRKKEFNCIQCGVKFIRRPHSVNYTPKFCTLKCAAIVNGKKRCGENNFNWKGGNNSRYIKKNAPRPRPSTCEICGEEGKKRNGIVLDHNHKTGKFRGWLCSNCNTVIGLSGENVNKLNKIISYISENSL